MEEGFVAYLFDIFGECLVLVLGSRWDEATGGR